MCGAVKYVCLIGGVTIKSVSYNLRLLHHKLGVIWGTSFAVIRGLQNVKCKVASPGNFSGVLLSKVLLRLYVAPSFV